MTCMCKIAIETKRRTSPMPTNKVGMGHWTRLPCAQSDEITDRPFSNELDLDGHVQCKKEICPSTGNCYVVLQQNKSAAKCCQVCKGCYYRGVHYQSGSQWNDPDDPCQTMTCQGGVVTVSRQTCRWNEEDAATADGHCQHLLPARPGECCPRCKGCQWRQARNGRNVTMAEGGPAASPDPLTEPCTQCQCLPGGSMMCTRQTCPVLPCPANKALLQPGACCPVCQGVRKEVQPAVAAPAVCQIGKKQFELGAKFRPDPCTNCTCQPNSTTVCLRDNSRRLGGSSSSSSCPNVHPATITVAPPLLASWPSDAVASKSATTQPSAMAVVASFQRQQEAAAAASSSSSSSSILSTHGKGSQPQQQQQQQPAMQTPTALPASRPLTCAYRGVTYQKEKKMLKQTTWALVVCRPSFFRSDYTTKNGGGGGGVSPSKQMLSLVAAFLITRCLLEIVCAVTWCARIRQQQQQEQQTERNTRKTTCSGEAR
ncbi:hypothetical protein OUZ56_003817 [Daphnia magna]|uniref:VWFC domain-containing protein n=1 Tax=Daphnia magna TaxID=35525 RepID=A0ABQ9YMW9_9CRUS|nr:hypothetical protein OUZ56_003817 [Daphnia magna]